MVTLASKIKIRRGLRDDLVDLDNAEFGFTTDTGEVFIGAPDLPSLQGKGKGEPNEQFPFKNIQLLTASTAMATIQLYTYAGTGAYTVQTGQTPNTPVARTYQKKFDDIVNFADFITGANANDDRSADLNRMVSEIYNNLAPTERKQCHISAGVHVIKDTIYLPPYTMLVGEGMDRTVISFEEISQSGITHVFETVDSLQQRATQIGTNGASYPECIELRDMTITTSKMMDFVRAYRASNVIFRRVKFVGQGATSVERHVLYADRLGDIIDMKNFEFDSCVFENVPRVFNKLENSTNVIKDVSIHNCEFINVYNVMNINNYNVKNIMINNNRFNDQITTAFQLDNVVNFTSTNNTYNDENAASPNYPIIIGELARKVSSFNDAFFGISVKNSSPDFIYISRNSAQFEYQGYIQSGRISENILAQQSGMDIGKAFAMDEFDSVKIQYNIRRGTIQRSGELTMTHDYTTGIIYDTYNENGDLGITFSVSTGLIDNKLSMILQYTTTAGMAGQMIYTFTATKAN